MKNAKRVLIKAIVTGEECIAAYSKESGKAKIAAGGKTLSKGQFTVLKTF